jgi:hypothetical protein
VNNLLKILAWRQTVPETPEPGWLCRNYNDSTYFVVCITKDNFGDLWATRNTMRGDRNGALKRHNSKGAQQFKMSPQCWTPVEYIGPPTYANEST